MERADWGSLSGDSLIDMACMVLRNATLTVSARGAPQRVGVSSLAGSRTHGALHGSTPCALRPPHAPRRSRNARGAQERLPRPLRRPAAPYRRARAPQLQAFERYQTFAGSGRLGPPYPQVDSVDLTQCRDLWGRLAGAGGRWERDCALAALAAAQRTEISLSSFADTLYSEVQVGGAQGSGLRVGFELQVLGMGLGIGIGAGKRRWVLS